MQTTDRNKENEHYSGVLFLPKIKSYINFCPHDLGMLYTDDDTHNFHQIVKNSPYYDDNYENIRINLIQKGWPFQEDKNVSDCGVYCCFFAYVLTDIWDSLIKLQERNDIYNLFTCPEIIQIFKQFKVDKFRVIMLKYLFGYNESWKNWQLNPQVNRRSNRGQCKKQKVKITIVKVHLI